MINTNIEVFIMMIKIKIKEVRERKGISLRELEKETGMKENI